MVKSALAEGHCQRLTGLSIDGLTYTLPAPIDLLGPGQQSIAAAIQQALDVVQQDLQLRIHPNPGRGDTIIQAPFPVKRVQVLSHTAQVVHVMEGNDAEYLHLNLESLPTGLYLLKIHTSKGDFVRKWSKI